MPFVAGVSGNPNGGKKDQRLFHRAINHALEARGNGDKMDALKLIASALVEQAIEGNEWAIREIGDRLDGKAQQYVEISKSDPFENMSAEDVHALKQRIGFDRGRTITLDTVARPRVEVPQIGNVQTIQETTRIP